MHNGKGAFLIRLKQSLIEHLCLEMLFRNINSLITRLRMGCLFFEGLLGLCTQEIKGEKATTQLLYVTAILAESSQPLFVSFLLQGYCFRITKKGEESCCSGLRFFLSFPEQQDDYYTYDDYRDDDANRCVCDCGS